MADPGTGLPSDNVDAAGERSAYTSPTNIGSYLWSTIAARDLGMISRHEASARMRKTLRALAALERDPGGSGQFFNWYDPATGARLTTWPDNGDHIYPFLSSVDNGWLAAALYMVANAEPRLRAQAARDRGLDGLRLLLRPRRGPALGRRVDGGAAACPAGPHRPGYWFTGSPLRHAQH